MEESPLSIMAAKIFLFNFDEFSEFIGAIPYTEEDDFVASQVFISDKEQLLKYRQAIKNNLQATIEEVHKVIADGSAMEAIASFKYDKMAKEPLSGEPENLIEVVNQSQTYLISLMAVEYLMKKHPGTVFTVNWGNIPGYDIESEDQSIIAECFAATSYRSNQKLVKDLKRLMDNQTASYKYEFFYDKEFEESHRAYYEDSFPGIKIVKFTGME